MCVHMYVCIRGYIAVRFIITLVYVSVNTLCYSSFAIATTYTVRTYVAASYQHRTTIRHSFFTKYILYCSCNYITIHNYLIESYHIFTYIRMTYATIFWKTNHSNTNTEIHFCLYLNVTLMHYPETSNI